MSERFVLVAFLLEQQAVAAHACDDSGKTALNPVLERSDSKMAKLLFRKEAVKNFRNF